MNILAVGGISDMFQPFSFPDGISCFNVDSCEEALKAVRYYLGRFDIVIVRSGSSGSDDEDELEALTDIFKIDPLILLAVCSREKYISLSAFSLPVFFTFQAPADGNTFSKMIARAEQITASIQGKIPLRIQVTRKRKRRFLFLDDIYYVQKARYGLTVVTARGEFRYRDRMEKFMDNVGGRFLRCHNSFSANLDHVSGMESSFLLLYNGIKIPISRSYRKSVRDYFRKNSFLRSEL